MAGASRDQWRSLRIRDLFLDTRPLAFELLLGRERSREDLTWLSVILAVPLVSGLAIGSLLASGRIPGFKSAELITLCVVALPAMLLSVYLGPRDLSRWIYQLAALTAPMVIAGMALVGPGGQAASVVIVVYSAAVYALVPRRFASFLVALLIVGYAVVVFVDDRYPAPAANLVFIATGAVTVGVLMASIVERIRGVAEDRQIALDEGERLAGELAESNRTLESRVAEQVEQIDGLSRLQRFLSPAVASALLSSADTSALETHRRQIAVVFCDLRGFTRFNSLAEPEEVVLVVDAYYAAVGGLVHDYQATLGAFQGDGVMAYFNDPLPIDDPAWAAVSMAMRLESVMAPLLREWDDRGYRLNYGIGLTYGYATLGTFGFEGRSDYSAFGSVVNMAARLSDEADGGDILLDAGAHSAVGERVAVEPVELAIKGFADPVTAYRIQR